MYFVYILFSQAVDKYYVGYTSDLDKRLTEHSLGSHKTKFTRKNANDWKLVYKELFDYKSQAIKREKEIKAKKSRSYIQTLISNSL